MWMQLWLSLGDVLGFKVNILKSSVCEMYHSTLNNISDMKSTIVPITYLSCECVCNIDISQNGNNFWFLKASNFTTWQHASRPESVVSENYYMINLEQTGVAVKCYNQISIGDWYWWFTKLSWYVCIQTCNLPSGVISEYVNPYIPTHTPDSEEYQSDHMQTPGWQPILCVAWCLIWLFAILKKSVVIHDTECPYWDQVSLNNTNQTKPNQTSNRRLLQFLWHYKYSSNQLLIAWI